jgi:hypothetical protein
MPWQKIAHGADMAAKELKKTGYLHLEVSDLGTRQAGEPRSTARAHTLKKLRIISGPLLFHYPVPILRIASSF